MKKSKIVLGKNRDVPQILKFVVNIELLVTKPIALMEQTVPALWHLNCELGFSHTADSNFFFFLTINGHFIQCKLGHLSRQTLNKSCGS